MKILVTGSGGFIGKNLVAELRNRGYREIFQCDRETTDEDLREFVSSSEFIFHLAGINRPERVEEFVEGNTAFTQHLLEMMKECGSRAPILLSSSIQAEQDNAYGKSKLAAEEAVRKFGVLQGNPTYLFRLPNVFGKWCKPNYNSVVATFCYQIARGIPITIHDPKTILTLVYIDDVVDEFIRCMEEKQENAFGEYGIPVEYRISLAELAELLRSFYDSRENLRIPDMGNSLTKKLYSTYLSYLPEDAFAYPLKMKADERGSFTEFLRTGERGQVSVNVAKPGITKGEHWHHTKNEKFMVVKGEGVIQFRRIGSDKVIEYKVSGNQLEVVDIPTGYVHNIINVGNEDLVTVMWANEEFDPDKPDTYFEKVVQTREI